jgi:hypothetical protein
MLFVQRDHSTAVRFSGTANCAYREQRGPVFVEKLFS